MGESVLYVYAITRQPATPGVEAVDETRHFGSVSDDGLSAVFSPVPREEFSQEVIDRRAGDLDWLGAIGYRHQAVVANLMKSADVVPLRAFTLFSSETALVEYLAKNRETLMTLLDRVSGKEEWTLRVEFDPEKWSESLTERVESLWKLAADAEAAGSGKAFLLRKKLEEERKRASREAEQQVIDEIERAVCDKLSCETISESRQQREGAFPQVNLLINRDEEAPLQELHQELTSRYAGEGITIALTGPWPPYTFAKFV